MCDERIGIASWNRFTSRTKAVPNEAFLAWRAAVIRHQRHQRPNEEKNIHIAISALTLYLEAGGGGGKCLINLFAQAMKYFMFERSSWPPSC